MKKVTILRGDKAPTIAILAHMELVTEGMDAMIQWVYDHRPECLPNLENTSPHDLFPHADDVSDNELLVELAGRKCYDSFGDKAGRKSNREYIANTQQGDIPHASILYHAKISFFFAGISRRVSHELIRNYVGADRDEEGAPSQECTRFTHHYGFFFEPPRYSNATALVGADLSTLFERSMQQSYDNYLSAVREDVALWTRHYGRPPTSIDKKRIYEAASSFLPHQAETSFVWTTNPQAIAKLVRERDNPAADLEIQRFARKLKEVSVAAYPNLFPQTWMKIEEAPCDG